MLRVLVEDWTGPGGTTPLQSYSRGSHIGDMTQLVSDAGVGGDQTQACLPGQGPQSGPDTWWSSLCRRNLGEKAAERSLSEGGKQGCRPAPPTSPLPVRPPRLPWFAPPRPRPHQAFPSRPHRVCPAPARAEQAGISSESGLCFAEVDGSLVLTVIDCSLIKLISIPRQPAAPPFQEQYFEHRCIIKRQKQRAPRASLPIE